MAELEIRDHFSNISHKYDPNDDPYEFIADISDHFTRDPNSPNPRDNNYQALTDNFDGVIKPVNSGSASIVNPDGNYEKKEIIEQGLGRVEEDNAVDKTGNRNAKQPISPIYPFVTSDPKMAKKSLFVSYNRTKTPIVDTMYRKGFRHVFFTRPECYIMSRDGDNANSLRLSEQCEYDEDFSSTYSRMPHVLKILSPTYVSGSYSEDEVDSNWNYLLSNQITSFSSAIKSTGESTSLHSQTSLGYTVTSPSFITSMSNSTISTTFLETKNLEVYEMLRMWMLYNHKRKYGLFLPPYNGYQYKNDFLSMQGSETGIPVDSSAFGNKAGVIYHPYDRALEQCSTIFEIFTDETDSKILYWCKYYGVYPEDVSIDGFGADINKAQVMPDGGLKCSATFRYQRKLEGSYKSLLEFNLNAGLTDNMGNMRSGLKMESSYPFLYRDSKSESFNTDTNGLLPDYIGASSMFTGSPYIVIGKHYDEITGITDENDIPFLMFLSLTKKSKLYYEMNMGIDNMDNNIRKDMQYFAL